MWMHELERYFEWHELIKLCHTRLYALAATLHKCALITNAAHCWMHCVYAAILPSKITQTKKSRTMKNENENEHFFKSLQESHVHDGRISFTLIFSLIHKPSLSVHFIFYLSQLLLWYFLHSVWKFHFVWLHLQKKQLFYEMNNTVLQIAFFLLLLMPTVRIWHGLFVCIFGAS